MLTFIGAIYHMWTPIVGYKNVKMGGLISAIENIFYEWCKALIPSKGTVVF
jgi:hypothetical protein